MPANTTIPTFLLPFSTGVPSRRHHVLIRRAILHLNDLRATLVYYAEPVEEGQPPRQWTACAIGLIRNKILVVDATMDELETRTSAAKRMEIEQELIQVNQVLGQLKTLLRI